MPIKVKEKSEVSGSVVGIDVSTKTGFVVISKLPGALDIVSEEIIFPSASDTKQRLWRMAEVLIRMKQRLAKYKPQLAVIEGYSHGSKFNQSVLVELGSMVRLACVQLGVKVVEVPPRSLKMFIVGTGKGDKNMVLMNVYKKWGFEAATDNVADAYGLARMGICLVGWEKPLAYENNVLQSIGQKKVRKSSKNVTSAEK